MLLEGQAQEAGAALGSWAQPLPLRGLCTGRGAWGAFRGTSLLFLSPPALRSMASPPGGLLPRSSPGRSGAHTLQRTLGAGRHFPARLGKSSRRFPAIRDACPPTFLLDPLCVHQPSPCFPERLDGQARLPSRPQTVFQVLALSPLARKPASRRRPSRGLNSLLHPPARHVTFRVQYKMKAGALRP